MVRSIYLLTVRKPQAPAPAKKRPTMNMARFRAPQHKLPPSIDSSERYRKAALRPRLSATQAAIKTLTTHPAWKTYFGRC